MAGILYEHPWGLASQELYALIGNPDDDTQVRDVDNGEWDDLSDDTLDDWALLMPVDADFTRLYHLTIPVDLDTAKHYPIRIKQRASSGVNSKDDVLLSTVLFGPSPAKAGDAMTLTSGERDAVADKVWDEPRADHVASGSFGEGVGLLLSRLGAWTGTGVNTVLGAFKALLSKVASVPSDIGGTFDPAADSTEAISDKITDEYWAEVKLNVDGDDDRDIYTVRWHKNTPIVTTTITSPTIQVVKSSDGSDLIGSTALTEIASTKWYRYVQDPSSVPAGEDVEVIVTATIDGSSRSFRATVGRDSSA